jgi:hypothetical protein
VLSDKTETYISMLVGVTLFVGGMIAVIILMKLLGQPQLKAQAQPQRQDYVSQNVNVPVTVDANASSNEFSTRNETITDFITMLYDDQFKGLNWTSFDIVNNGPDPVYFSVNNHDSMQSSITPGQSVTVDLKQKHAIKKVYLRCDTGKTANVNFYILK